MSPRRSSRARSSANPPAAPSQTASSTSSSTIKNTRVAQRSESIDEPNAEDDASQSQAATSEPIMPRRSRRNGGEDTKPNEESQIDDEPGDNAEQDPEQEDEVTRCICGNAEYLGPNPLARDLAKGIESLETLGDDLGNFFVQCDLCSVWQHGGCMGLVDENNLPDQYFCELCKPEFHRVTRNTNGTKFSRYLPITQAVTSRDSSLSSSGQRKKDPKNRQEPTKRRATMNSRVAYDEDELIRRAIEESREMGTLGKRMREDGDDLRPQVKRQRTASSSSDAASKRSQSPVIDEIPTRIGSKGKQTLRGAAAKNTREKELREKQKDQAAAARADAANKRNARSERRRGEDSPPPSPSLSPSKGPAKESKSKGGTPTPTSNPRTIKTKARGAMKRGRLGRNQYTKARDEREAALAAGADSDTPMRDTSHDRTANTNGVNGNTYSPQGRGRINGESGRSSKAKTHPARTSMNEMKRRVAAILEFVGQLQTQTGRNAGSKNGSGNGSAGGTPAVSADIGGALVGVAGLVKAVQAASDEVNEALASNGNGATDMDSSDNGSKGSGTLVRLNLRDDGEFRGMESVQMMETLTRELVGWQSVYGVYSR